MEASALVFSGPSPLAIAFVKRLLEDGIRVDAVCGNPKAWEGKIDNPLLHLYSNPPKQNYLYAACLQLNSSEDSLAKFLNFSISFTGKSIAVLSYYKEELPDKNLVANLADQSTQRKTKIYFVGESLGNTVDGPVANIISLVADKRKVSASLNKSAFYIANPQIVVARLVHALYSFNASEQVLLGDRLSGSALLSVIKSIASVELSDSYKIPEYTPVADIGMVSAGADEKWLAEYIKTRLPAAPKEQDASPLVIPRLTQVTIVEVPPARNEKSERPQTKDVVGKNTKPGIKAKLEKRKNIVISVTRRLKISRRTTMALVSGLAAVVIFGPMLLLLTSVISARVAYGSISRGNIGQVRLLLGLSKQSAGLARDGFSMLTPLPIVGRGYSGAVKTTNILTNTTDIGMRLVNLEPYAATLIAGITGKQDYDVIEISQKISLELNALYRDMSFLDGELRNFSNPLLSMVSKLDSISEYRMYLSGMSDAAAALPALLGKERPTTYLVLFQNNLELRPTGGFVGSFALVTFSGGRLIDRSVFDVYTADGQQKGFVKPPDPIVEHLGEPSWFLRDSNWDPDFPTSAARAEWFLDKTLDREVDGVIAINLEVAKSILEVSGPVNLSDFEGSVDHLNMYEKVQHEVEANFFPGSTKKADYLTALSNALLYRLTDMTQGELVGLARKLFVNAEARDIQAYIHNRNAAEAISRLGWSGEIVPRSCGDNCIVNWFGAVEANLGVNKANYNVERKQDWLIEASGETLKNTLVITYTNLSQDHSRQPETRYKNYLRLLAPTGVKLVSVKLLADDNVTDVNYDLKEIDKRTEVGVLVDVPTGSSRAIAFVWETEQSPDLSKPGSMELEVRKQSGVTAPLNVRLNFPSTVEIFGEPAFTLTESTNTGYNTFLSKDFGATVHW